jgi:prepilin-type N-terminal cleavage/methylation domain-containing protein
MKKYLKLQKREEKGFTLIEILLSMTISLIGFSASATLILLGNQQFFSGQNVTRIQQQARIALGKMVEELQETTIGTINPDTSSIDSENPSNIISFASARDDNNAFVLNEEGTPDWSHVIIYFRDADSNILYRYREVKTNWEENYNVSEFNPSEISDKEPMATSVTGVEFWVSNNLLNIKLKIVIDPKAQSLSGEEFLTAIESGEIKEEELITAIGIRN